jgi:hypothetical protein
MVVTGLYTLPTTKELESVLDIAELVQKAEYWELLTKALVEWAEQSEKRFAVLNRPLTEEDRAKARRVLERFLTERNIQEPPVRHSHIA